MSSPTKFWEPEKLFPRANHDSICRHVTPQLKRRQNAAVGKVMESDQSKEEKKENAQWSAEDTKCLWWSPEFQRTTISDATVIIVVPLKTGENVSWFTKCHQGLKNPEWNWIKNSLHVGQKANERLFREPKGILLKSRRFSVIPAMYTQIHSETKQSSSRIKTWAVIQYYRTEQYTVQSTKTAAALF